MSKVRNALTSALVVSVVAAIPAPGASAQIFTCFALEVTFPVGPSPSSIATGDLTGDGVGNGADLAILLINWGQMP